MSNTATQTTTETVEQQFVNFVNSISENKRSLSKLAKLPEGQKSYLLVLFNKHIYAQQKLA